MVIICYELPTTINIDVYFFLDPNGHDNLRTVIDEIYNAIELFMFIIRS